MMYGIKIIFRKFNKLAYWHILSLSCKRVISLFVSCGKVDRTFVSRVWTFSCRFSVYHCTIHFYHAAPAGRGSGEPEEPAVREAEGCRAYTCMRDTRNWSSRRQWEKKRNVEEVLRSTYSRPRARGPVRVCDVPRGTVRGCDVWLGRKLTPPLTSLGYHLILPRVIRRGDWNAATPPSLYSRSSYFNAVDARKSTAQRHVHTEPT